MVRPRNRAQHEKLRASLWPSIDRNALHTGAKASIPENMPQILAHISKLIGSRGALTYLDLWCQASESVVVVSSERQRALSAGFSAGARGTHNWREKIKSLHELGFVSIRSGASGPRNYILLLDPNHAIER